MLAFSCLLLCGLLVKSIVAIPTMPSNVILNRDTTYPDAPYDVPQANLTAALKCPNGTNNTKGIVFLVHGTGSTGDESWTDSPYNAFLPKLGYAICWVNFPGRSLGDLQVSAEYVAYNIGVLAKSSATGQVVTIGHSQGAGLNIQWALLYWPSTRKLVSRYIALSGDFHGTVEGPIACLAQDLLRGGCLPAIIQQTVGSHMLAAQNVRGNQSLVPTTSIYTHYDEIIQDENLNPTSILPGADNFALQDLDVCGPLHLAEHFSMIVDPAAYEIVKLALGAGSGKTPIAQFNPLYCTYFVEDQLLNLTAVPALIESAVIDAINVSAGGTVAKTEPALKQYVCDEGDAPETLCSGSSSFSPPN